MRKLLDGEAHGEQRCAANVDAIDGFNIDRGDGPGDSFGANLRVELIALCLAEFLGVGQAAKAGVAVEDHGGCDDRAKHRSTADFVEPGNAQRAGLERSVLELPAAHGRLDAGRTF